jgi:cytochrome P450
VLSRYTDVRRMLTTPAVFGQSRFYEGAMIDAFGRETMVILEPPRHTEVRAPAADYFRPRRLEAALGPAISQVAREVVGALPARFEVNRDLSEPLVMGTMALLFGCPDTGTLRRLYRPLVEYLKRSRARAAGDEVRRQGREAGAELVAFLLEAARGRGRGVGVAVDLVGHLLDAGMPLEEVGTVCALTLIGGVDTTVRGLANTLLGLLSTPGTVERTRSEPGLLENAFDEGLRWISPLQLKGRELRVDCELHGVRMEAGRAVIGLLGSANRDPSRYHAPDSYRVGRPTGHHLAFGFGLHYCVGAPLARLEARELLRALLDRFPRVALDRSAPVAFDGPVYRSPLELWLTGGD